MSWFDVIIIVILAGFAWYGFFYGLIRVIGNLIGLIIGAYIAAHYYLNIYNYLARFIPGSAEIGKIIVFILVFTIVSHLISWVIALLEKGFDILSIIPFLKSANRILGLVFGLLEGIFFLGVAAYILNRHLPSGLPLAQWLAGSHMVPLLISVSKILAPFLPQVFNKIQNLV